MNKNRAIIDIETGGFNIYNSGIVEIGIVFFDEKYNIIDKYETLIKPYKKHNSIDLMEYSKRAEYIHGHSIEKIQLLGKECNIVCNEIISKIKYNNPIQLIGHNLIKFDLPRIINFFERFTNESTDFLFINNLDTINLSKELLNSDSYSLEYLCNGLNLAHENKHSAMGDCCATLELLKYLER